MVDNCIVSYNINIRLGNMKKSYSYFYFELCSMLKILETLYRRSKQFHYSCAIGSKAFADDLMRSG